ncbi:MAG: peptidylprolyl isomerase [Bacteroidota bacterium]|nr:peptidylprolyl isomerase [Bacteroidota bacterium]
MKKMTNFLIATIALLFSCSDKSEQDSGIFADIQTTKGVITVELEYEKTPVTVANFITLAEGTNPFVKPEYKGKKFYDGLNFHRVIADFMIQGGCPEGSGRGEPGYRFIDEITDLKHNRAGTLSMANSGPQTNGSQFFITHKDTPWLDGKHTVFGYVVKGQDVVDKIAQNDKIEKITIIRKGKTAENFDAVKVFSDYFKERTEKEKAEKEKTAKMRAEKMEYFKNIKAKSSKTKSGLEYTIIEKGTGKKPNMEQDVYIHYAGFLEDGTIFDTSMKEIAQEFQVLDASRSYTPFSYKLKNKTGLIPGFLEGLELMNFGDKAVLFIPAHLGYGKTRMGPIPANSNLIFIIQLLEKP